MGATFEAASRGQPRASAAAPPVRVAPHRRHVWVRVPTGDGGELRPGLLLAWESLGGGRWRALVSYVLETDTDPVLVQEWTAAEEICRAECGW